MDERSSSKRVRLVTLAILVALFAALIVLALASGGGDDPGGLRLERTGQNPDGSTLFTFYLEDPADNVPETAGARRRVRLRCFDLDGEEIVDSMHAWPFTDTDNGSLNPHVHATLPQLQAGRLARCRLEGTEGPLEGSLGTRG